MKVLFSNYKGGVGKSSIAYNMSLLTRYKYVTNDTTTLDDTEVYQINSGLRRIPPDLLALENVIFDFGAMSTQVDPKLTHALKVCDLVVIPTLTDPRSLQATLEFVNFITDSGLPYVIIINNFTQWSKCERAEGNLRGSLGNVPIFYIKHTTLFERVAEHGRDWLYNVFQRRGIARLISTREKHDEVYEKIMRIGYESANIRRN